MKRRGGGSKRSSWATFKRRLLLVRLLLRGPATKPDLIDQVQNILQEHGYPPDSNSALKNDFEALRNEFGCEIRFERSSQQYILHSLGELTLLDLTDEAFDALLFLHASFPQDESLPQYANMRSFFTQVLQLLPPDRRQHVSQPLAMSLELHATPDRIAPQLLRTLRRAVGRKQIAFRYRSNEPAGAQVWHRVAPYEIVFRPNGHAYLDATTLETRPSDSTVRLPMATSYRLTRILPQTLELLQLIFPPERVIPASYHLRYRLHPKVARRRDVAPLFPDSVIVYQDDESAIIEAVTSNLWQARQTLLRYGSACIVLEPPELIALFQQTVSEMAANYRLAPPNETTED